MDGSGGDERTGQELKALLIESSCSSVLHRVSSSAVCLVYGLSEVRVPAPFFGIAKSSRPFRLSERKSIAVAVAVAIVDRWSSAMPCGLVG